MNKYLYSKDKNDIYYNEKKKWNLKMRKILKN